MMGLGVTITPVITGNLLMTITGSFSFSTANTQSSRLRYGTGTAPVNGAAPVGTLVGSVTQGTAAAAGEQLPFTMIGVVTGLSTGTAYWIDAALWANAGTAQIFGVTVAAIEF
jgi:hypothetical protein